MATGSVSGMNSSAVVRPGPDEVRILYRRDVYKCVLDALIQSKRHDAENTYDLFSRLSWHGRPI